MEKIVRVSTLENYRDFIGPVFSAAIRRQCIIGPGTKENI